MLTEYPGHSYSSLLKAFVISSKETEKMLSHEKDFPVALPIQMKGNPSHIISNSVEFSSGTEYTARAPPSEKRRDSIVVCGLRSIFIPISESIASLAKATAMPPPDMTLPEFAVFYELFVLHVL